jgi:tetratricopeptide (TPR) repeat protein
MGNGPLDHPRLLAIDLRLDQGQLDEAQQLMAELGDVGFFRYATTYLATRLLYQRGRLDAAEVAERLRELLMTVEYFPEARAMLEAAESGTLDQGRSFKQRSQRPASAPAIELGSAESLHEASLAESPAPQIPRAARLPGLSVRPSRPPLPVLPDLDPPPPPPPSSQSAAAADDAPEITIRSVPPPALELAAPTLLQIAALLDAGKPELALDELARQEHGDTPEVVLLQARTFCQLGCHEEADQLLARLSAAPLLDPELRAGVARLLTERGRPQEALAQARHAHSDDPEPAMVRLTLAWTAVRAVAQSPDPALAALASKLLSGLKARRNPRPDLVLALRSRLLAMSGDSERAISLARRALEIDARNADALAALAVASARLAHADDALEAWQRLCAENEAQAATIAPSLCALGIAVAVG